MSEINLQIEKIQKTSKMVLIVTNIFKIFFIVCSVILLCSGTAVIAFQDMFNEEVMEYVESGELQKEVIMAGMDAEMVEQIVERGSFAVVIGIYIITMAVILGIIAVLTHFIGKVFKTLRESYSPFVPKIVKELKVAFILIAILSFTSGVGIGAVVSLALWSLFYIFKYGCELQRQSDETL